MSSKALFSTSARKIACSRKIRKLVEEIFVYKRHPIRDDGQCSKCAVNEWTSACIAQTK